MELITKIVSIQLLLIILEINLISSTNASSPDHYQVTPSTLSATLLTDRLLQDIFKQWSITGLKCSIKFVLQEAASSNQETLSWTTIAQFPEPIQVFHQMYKNFPQGQQILASKFTSNCWTIVISVYSTQVSTPVLQLGHHQTDHYVFISHNKHILEKIMFQTINYVARKHGLYCEVHSEDKIPSIGYLVDPPSYTGSFIQNPHFSVQRNLRNLNGRQIPVAFLNIAPYIVKTSDTTIDGIQANLLKEISTHANVTWVLNKSSGIGTLENGTWSGVIGEIVSGQAELTPTLSPSYERYPYVSYTSPAYLEILVFCLTLPQPLRQWHALIDPLNSIVWLGIFLSYVSFCCVYIVKINMEGHMSQNVTGIEQTFHNVSKVFLIFYTTLLEQTCRLHRGNISRFILINWIIFSHVIGVAYKCNLVSYLTFTEKPRFPTNFKELHAYHDYTIMMFTLGGLELELFRSSPSVMMQDIVKRMTITKDAMECMRAATHPKTVCIAWKGITTNHIWKNSAKEPKLNGLVWTKEPGGLAHGCIALRKRSIFQEHLNWYVGAAKGTGLMSQWRQVFQRGVIRDAAREHRNLTGNGTSLSDNSKEKEHGLSVADLLIIFVVIFLGCFASSCAFIVEHGVGFAQRNFKGKINHVLINVEPDSQEPLKPTVVCPEV